MAACTAAVAGYLYYLANAGNEELLEMAHAHTNRVLNALRIERRRDPTHRRSLCDEHSVSMERLKRWIWGGDRNAVLDDLAECEARVRKAAGRRTAVSKSTRPEARLVPHRTALLTPDPENADPAVRKRIRVSRLRPWALYYADGKRSFAEIADAIAHETGKDISLEHVREYFEAHETAGYVKIVNPREMVTRAQLVKGLKAIGLRRGMDVMVHSSLSKIGHVAGGSETVIDALLDAIGRTGTLMMPSFNHSLAKVYNPATTPTINGAIPDAMWRRRKAVRSLDPSHPVAAIGPKAENYCSGHLRTGIWSQQSPIGRVVHGGGYVLCIGVGVEAVTVYHVAENAAGCRCIAPFGCRYAILMPEGTVRKVRGLAWRRGRCPVGLDRLEKALDRRKLLVRGEIGNAPSFLVKAIDLWRVRREQLKPACPVCKIRPNLKWKLNAP
jgi:aminoglycoside 3-N-acetyltransferase